VPLELIRQRAAHFELRFAADSAAAAAAETIVRRLEAARSRLISALEVTEDSTACIPVYLVEMEPGSDGRADVIVVDGVQGILATYRADAPAVGVERTLAELLLGQRVRADLLLDGLVGHALREHTPEHTDLRAELTAHNVGIAHLLDGQANTPTRLYLKVATSFVGFLIGRFGVARVRRLAIELEPAEPDRAFLEMCDEPLSAIEQAWVDSLTAAEPDQPGIIALLRRCAGFLRPHWRASIAIGLCLLVATAFDLVLPLSFRFLIDNAILPGDYALMTVIIGGLLVLFLAQTLATLVREYLAARVGARVLNGLRAHLFQHLLTLSPGFYSRAQTGDLLARYSADLVPLELVVTKVLPIGLMVMLGLVGSIALLFLLEWRLALITLVLLPSFALGPVLLGRRAARASYERQRDIGTVMSAAHESISGHMVIRAFGLQRFLIQRFAADLERLTVSTIRSSFIGSLLAAGGGISLSLTQVVSLGLGAFLVARGDMSVGALVAFQGLLANVVGPLRELAQIVEMLQQASGALQHLDEVLDQRPRITDAAGAVELPSFQDRLRFQDVSFRYEDDTAALSDVSFGIGAGQSVAIVGPSGCGKSTILNLLTRNYDPTSGSVTIDGLDLRQVSQESLRAQLGVVFQDTALFDMSVRENIRLGRLDASDGEVEQAARLAEVHEAIVGLPAGYDTPVGERGGRLSGGQRQRIALARALLRQPTMLILDEPTSALDPETESAVNATLERLRPGRTTVTVTHRLASVASCDDIVVLDRGRIVGRGTHAELVNREGVYRRLWQQAQLAPDAAAAQVEQLHEVPYFRSLDTVLLTAIAERFTRVERAAGEIFFNAGDAGDAFYLVVRGQVDVLAPGPSGDEIRVAVLRDGDYFGEMALIEDIPRTATVRAASPTITLVIDRAQFLALLNSLPRLRSAFEAIIESRRAAERALIGPRA